MFFFFFFFFVFFCGEAGGMQLNDPAARSLGGSKVSLLQESRLKKSGKRGGTHAESVDIGMFKHPHEGPSNGHSREPTVLGCYPRKNPRTRFRKGQHNTKGGDGPSALCIQHPYGAEEDRIKLVELVICRRESRSGREGWGRIDKRFGGKPYPDGKEKS